MNLVVRMCPILLLSTVALAADEPPESNIPDGEVLVGVGVGIMAPTDVLAPNIASLRVRVATGVDIEPEVGLHVNRIGFVGGEPSDLGGTRSTALSLALDARVRLARHDDFELMAIGRLAGGSYASTTESPSTPPSSFEGSHASAGWGLGISWWARPRLSVSADLRNDLLQVHRGQTTINGDPTGPASTSYQASLALQPRARVMAHVMF